MGRAEPPRRLDSRPNGPEVSEKSLGGSFIQPELRVCMADGRQWWKLMRWVGPSGCGKRRDMNCEMIQR